MRKSSRRKGPSGGVNLQLKPFFSRNNQPQMDWQSARDGSQQTPRPTPPSEPPTFSPSPRAWEPEFNRRTRHIGNRFKEGQLSSTDPDLRLSFAYTGGGGGALRYTDGGRDASERTSKRQLQRNSSNLGSGQNIYQNDQGEDCRGNTPGPSLRTAEEVQQDPLHLKVQSAWADFKQIKATSSQNKQLKTRGGTRRPSTASARVRNRSSYIGQAGNSDRTSSSNNRGEKRENADLTAVKSVMKKLYRRNVELSKEIQQLRGGGTHTTPSTSSPSSMSRPRKGSEGKGENHPHFLQFLLSQRELTINDLKAKYKNAQSQIQTLSEQLQQSAFTGTSSPSAFSSASASATSSASSTHLNQELYPQFATLRHEYAEHLNKRLDQIDVSKLNRSARGVLNTMKQHLALETAKRQIQEIIFTQQINTLSNQNCDHYVTIQMLRQELKDLKEEMAKRDELDRQVEQQTYSLLTRSKKLEEENASIKQKLISLSPKGKMP